MSNYTQIVSYGPKDSLSHGDPNKALKGVQLDGEFGAIATAISSKQDSNPVNLITRGTDGVAGLLVNGSGTSNLSQGLYVNAGTSASDVAVDVKNKSNFSYFQIRGDGHIFAGSFDFTPLSATFTATLSGIVSGTANLAYVKVGPQVTLYSTSASGFAVSTGNVVITSLPSVLRPTVSIQGIGCLGISGGAQTVTYSITSAGVVTFLSSNGGVLSSGSNMPVGTLFTYAIQ